MALCTLVVATKGPSTASIRQGHGVPPLPPNLGLPLAWRLMPRAELYVGDRRGAILQVAENGTFRVFARLDPTMTGYHLAFGDDGWLYVSYPTLSGSDQIYRITPDGEVHPFVRGLGRAQGMAFDAVQNLYIVAHYEGEGGVIRITPTGSDDPRHCRRQSGWPRFRQAGRPYPLPTTAQCISSLSVCRDGFYLPESRRIHWRGMRRSARCRR